MWLLSTKTARLEFFNGPNDKRLRKDGGYAILSHVWQGKEQTFQDIIALSSHTPTPDSDTPRSRASPKIRECCRLASAHGYRWVWIDTCCINKESSAELSEAVNSMFEWYRKADVCYVYLFDVTIRDLDFRSPFYRSKWFTRGWTLQELIAPQVVLFLLSDWTVLGTRTSLVNHLNRITSIDEDVLLYRRALGKVSISTRMSWASERQTTRVEDEAYCLMGIFGVHMPTIYGEGRAAFYRLQEEIMKISPDQTLFAWDWKISWMESNFEQVFERWSTTYTTMIGSDVDEPYLFAPSPSHFNLRNQFEPMHIADAIKVAKDACMELASSGLLQFEVKTTTPSPSNTAVFKQRISKFTVTSHGMRSTLPIIEFRKIVANLDGRGDSEDGREEGKPDSHLSIAVLGCKNSCSGAVLGLLLYPFSFELSPQHQGDSNVFGIGPNIPSYADHNCRLVELSARGNDLGLKTPLERPALDTAKPPQVPHQSHHGYMAWATIHIVHRPLPHMTQDTSTSAWESTRPRDNVVFRFSRWSLAELESDGFQASPNLQDSLRDLLPPETYQDSHFGRLPAQKCSVTFTSNTVPGEAFTVVLDQCICSDGLTKDIQLRADVTFAAKRLTPTEPWAINPSDRHDTTSSTVTALDHCSFSPSASNTCSFSRFHIGRSHNWMKRFGDSDRAVELTFRLQQTENGLYTFRALYVCLVDIRLAADVYMSLYDDYSFHIQPSESTDTTHTDSTR